MREAELRRFVNRAALVAGLVAATALPNTSAAQTPTTDPAATQPRGNMNNDDYGERDDGMDLGWLGLLGLAGLLGLRRRDDVRYTPGTRDTGPTMRP